MLRKNQAYSLFRHLGKLIFFGKYRDSMPMAVFSAYFDASGTKKEHPVLTVAGFVARVKKWNRFDAEWSAILAEEKVTSMHMTDFASSQGEFVSWKGQTDRRREFISRLSKCIHKNTNKGFASSVLLPDYREVNVEFMLSEYVGHPYTLCARACLGALAVWAKKKKVRTEEMLVAVEQGDEGQGELIRMAASDPFTVIPLPKHKARAFQAGDVAAWKIRTLLQNAIYGRVESEEDAEKIMRSLDPVRVIVHRNRGYDKAALRKLCIDKRMPRREINTQ